MENGFWCAQSFRTIRSSLTRLLSAWPKVLQNLIPLIPHQNQEGGHPGGFLLIPQSSLLRARPHPATNLRNGPPSQLDKGKVSPSRTHQLSNAGYYSLPSSSLPKSMRSVQYCLACQALNWPRKPVIVGQASSAHSCAATYTTCRPPVPYSHCPSFAENSGGIVAVLLMGPHRTERPSRLSLRSERGSHSFSTAALSRRTLPPASTIPL